MVLVLSVYGCHVLLVPLGTDYHVVPRLLELPTSHCNVVKMGQAVNQHGGKRKEAHVCSDCHIRMYTFKTLRIKEQNKSNTIY